METPNFPFQKESKEQWNARLSQLRETAVTDAFRQAVKERFPDIDHKAVYNNFLRLAKEKPIYCDLTVSGFQRRLIEHFGAAHERLRKGEKKYAPPLPTQPRKMETELTPAEKLQKLIDSALTEDFKQSMRDKYPALNLNAVYAAFLKWAEDHMDDYANRDVKGVQNGMNRHFELAEHRRLEKERENIPFTPAVYPVAKSHYWEAEELRLAKVKAEKEAECARLGITPEEFEARDMAKRQAFYDKCMKEIQEKKKQERLEKEARLAYEQTEEFKAEKEAQRKARVAKMRADAGFPPFVPPKKDRKLTH